MATRKTSVSEPFTQDPPLPILSSARPTIPYHIFLTVILVVASFFLGMLFTKVQYLEQQKTNPTVLGTQQQAQVTAQPTKAPVTLNQIKALFNDKNIVFGDKNSKNLFVEIADPSCPWCHVAAGHNPELARQVGKPLSTDGGTYNAPVPEMKRLVDEKKAAFVWIYTPGHGNGEMGTKALYCAYEQDKFWPVHDKLMNNDGYTLLNNTVKNDATQSQTLVDFLNDVSDPALLKVCLDSGKYDKKLSEDTAIASQLGVQGTPGFFINTTNFGGAYSWEEMKSAVQ